MVLDSFNSDGTPKLRKPNKDITINMLMLHAAGFGYEFFSENDRLYRESKGVPSILTSTFDSIKSVLLFEPGERWNYGVNIDWVGKVIEAVCGKRLEEVMKEYIFEPL